MPRLQTAQTNFASGELDPAMRLRVDTGAYANGAKELTNVQLLNTGGGARRPGTYHVYQLAGASRLRQFEFDEDEAYVFAFQHNSVQIFNAVTGAFIQTIGSARWTTAILRELTFAHLGDVLIVFHKLMQPHIIRRTGLTTFVLADFAFSVTGTKTNQPFYKLSDDSVTLTPSAASGSITLTASVATFTAGWVGARVKIYDTEVLITGYTSSTVVTGTVGGEILLTLDADPFKTQKGSTGVIVTWPFHNLTTGQSVTLSGANDVGGVTTAQLTGAFVITTLDRDRFRITAGGAATSSVDGGGPSVHVAPAAVPTRSWEEQVYNSINGWPACGAFHQQRLFLGGSPEIPAALAGSVIGDYFSFALGSAEERDGLFITVGQENGVAIRHIISGKHLQIFTEAGEYYVPQADGAAIAPLTITALKQSPYGTASVAPISLDGATIFLQKSKTAVREYIYTEAERSYNSNPLSLAASHMLSAPVDLAVLYGTAARPEQYAMLTNGNGELAVFHSARVERLAGWAHWTTATGHLFYSVCVCLDKVWTVVNRDGTYFLERFATTDELTIDAATDFSDAVAKTVWTIGSRYANKTVWVLTRNDDLSLGWSLGPHVCTAGGQITLGSAQKKIVVGFWYPFEIETLTPNITIDSGTLMGEKKRIAEVDVGLHSSQSVTVEGQSLILRQVTDDFTVPPSKVSGFRRFRMLGYSPEPTVTISQVEPLPLTVLGLVMKVSV